MEHSDWEKNVTGMTGVVRLARHEPEVLIVEYKSLMALLLKQIKNLRSQVGRFADTNDNEQLPIQTSSTGATFYNYLGI